MKLPICDLTEVFQHISAVGFGDSEGESNNEIWHTHGCCLLI